jgi:hypothetical protein
MKRVCVLAPRKENAAAIKLLKRAYKGAWIPSFWSNKWIDRFLFIRRSRHSTTNAGFIQPQGPECANFTKEFHVNPLAIFYE